MSQKNISVVKTSSRDFKPDLNWVEQYIHGVNSGLSVDQILRKLCQDLEGHAQLKSAQVFLFDSEGLLVQSGGYGVPQEYSRNLKFALDTLHPITDCARSEIILTINSVEEFINRYPNSEDWIPRPSPALVIPLRSGNIIDGVFYVSFLEEDHLGPIQIDILSSALSLIAGICQIALTRGGSGRSEAILALSESDSEEVAKLSLSNRQLRIAKMIAQGLTNKHIARALDFSEATIRYETIKLYERLRVKNRSHAAARIHKLGLG